MALYGSIPLVLSHADHHNAAMLWLNAAETWVDVSYPYADSEATLEANAHFFSEAGDAVLYLYGSGADVSSLYQKTALISGFPLLPPLFSLGYHQCRWNYVSSIDVIEVHENFEAHKIPVDVVWLDIEHTDGKRYFTWNEVMFEDAGQMIDELAKKGRKMVTIADPHIKADDNYRVYSGGLEKSTVGKVFSFDLWGKGMFVKNQDGLDFKGHCWPGESVWIDYLRSDARSYWSS